MSLSVSRIELADTRTRAGTPRRVLFVALLASAPFLPHLSTSAFTFPAVANFPVLLAFAALMVVPVLGRSELRRLSGFDLLALLAVLIPLGFEQLPRQWPIILLYPILGYLLVRMLVIGQVGNSAGRPGLGPARTLRIPRGWLLVGIGVLVLVHAGWALTSRVSTDIGEGSVKGSLALLHARSLYGPQHAAGGIDPHTDTYGPVNYAAYVPFAVVSSARSAAHLATLFFTLLTALLLFCLGRQLNGPQTGVLLAYCWLAFPLTLYEEALGANDSIVAASIVAVMLVSRSPGRRGAAAAIAGWTKLSPLALIPLLAAYSPSGPLSNRRLAKFALGFALVTAILFIPVFAHSTPATFINRTFGFQSRRTPSDSLWSSLQLSYAIHAPWLASLAKIAHGLLTAGAATLALLLFRVPYRRDTIGLAATSAAVLIAIQVCLGYYSYSYILWFAPLILIACIAAEPFGLDGEARTDAKGRPRARGRRHGVPGAGFLRSRCGDPAVDALCDAGGEEHRLPEVGIG